MSDFIFRILFGGRNRIGRFTLIHNVLRSVKLLPCQKITALHTATHAFVIRRRLVLNPGTEWVYVDLHLCVWGGGDGSKAVSGTITPFPPSDKQSITNYFRHKADDFNNADTIELYDAKIQLRFLFGAAPSYRCSQPSVMLSILIGDLLSQRADSGAASVIPLTLH